MCNHRMVCNEAEHTIGSFFTSLDSAPADLFRSEVWFRTSRLCRDASNAEAVNGCIPTSGIVDNKIESGDPINGGEVPD